MKSTQAQIASPLLHRLTDDKPGERAVHDTNRYVDYTQLHQDIKQNLESLLNTRLGYFDVLKQESQLSRSLLSYGIADFSGQYDSIKKHQLDLCQQIQETILHFEPRLQQVTVSLVDNDDALTRRFSFRIAGNIHLKPTPVQAVFEFDLDIVRYQFTFNEGM
jgi:type VI secretion system protein ImpF